MAWSTRAIATIGFQQFACLNGNPTTMKSIRCPLRILRGRKHLVETGIRFHCRNHPARTTVKHEMNAVRSPRTSRTLRFRSSIVSSNFLAVFVIKIKSAKTSCRIALKCHLLSCDLILRGGAEYHEYTAIGSKFRWDSKEKTLLLCEGKCCHAYGFCILSTDIGVRSNSVSLLLFSI